MDIKYTPTYTPPFFYVAMLNRVELGKKRSFFPFATCSFHKGPAAEQWGGPEESWPKRWGWLWQGVFRASLPHTRSHQNTLACCGGDLQSLKEMTATDIYCHPAHLKKHSATDWRPSFVNWGFMSKFIWPNVRHLPHGLRWDTQSHWSLPQLDVRHFQKAAQVLRQGWLHCSFGTLCQVGWIQVLMNKSLCPAVPFEDQRTGKSWTGKLQLRTHLTWMSRVQKGYSKSLTFLFLGLFFLALAYISWKIPPSLCWQISSTLVTHVLL